MPLLESRPTSPAKLASIALGAVFIAVVFVLFIAPMIVRHDYAILSAGERVSIEYNYGLSGDYAVVESVNGGIVTVRDETGKRAEVPAEYITEK